MLRSRDRLCNGFTLIEVVVVVAAMAILTSAGYVTVMSVRETARESKLETDVANLNSSVQMYQASGGNLSDLSDVAGDTTEQKVLNKLKTRGDDDAVAYQMGMKGSFVDVRTMAVTQSADEAGTSQSRAVWDAASQRFVISTSGAGGVKEFQLNEALAAADIEREARERSLTASDVNSDAPVWVWEYTDATPIVSTEGGVPGAGPATDPGIPTGSGLLTLNPPTFQEGGASRTLAELADLGANSSGAFTETLLNNSNVGIASTISPSSSVTIVASGTGFDAGAFYVQSNEPDVWQDSPTATTQPYSVEAFEPELTISSSGQSFTPFELGVPIADGGSVAQATVTATISAWDNIPDPPFMPPPLLLQIGTGTAALSGGATTKETTLTLSTGSGWDFSSGTPSLVVTAAVDSQNEVLFANDDATATFTATKPTLAVNIAPSSGELAATDTITISGAGTLPANYVISYTTSGASTASGSMTGGPISLSPPPSGSITVNATISPPASFSNWFVSGSATASFTVPVQSGTGGALPSGILTSSLILNSNGLVKGSVTLVEIPGQPLKFDMNSNAQVTGDVFLPGLPTIVKNPNVTIGGGIVDLTGSPLPTYTVTLNANAKIDGTLYRRSVPATMPTVTTPTGLTNFSGTNIGNQQTATLPPGNYTSTINANAQATINIGTPGSSTPEQYIFNGLNMSSGSTLNVLGPVVITMTQGANFNSNTIIGNPSHPEYLQFNVVSGDFNVNSNVSVYAMVVSPNGKVTFNSNSTFKGSVTAKEVIINSNSATVEFTLPPVGG